MTLLPTSTSSNECEDAVSMRDESESAKALGKSSNTLQVSDTPPCTTPCNDVPVLRRAAMDYLARREHSFFELAQKLQKKFPDTEKQLLLDVISADRELLLEVLETLKSENLQSDERFTEGYVRYRKSRGFAYLHIRGDLSARRVSEVLIDKYLHIDDEHWQLTAEQLVAKKLRYQESPSYGSKLHRKIMRLFPHGKKNSI